MFNLERNSPKAALRSVRRNARGFHLPCRRIAIMRDSVTLEYVFQVALGVYRRQRLLEWDDMKWDEISPYSMPRSTPYRDCQRTGHWPLGCGYLVFCKQTRFCHMFRRILWQTFALLWHQSPWELIEVGLWSSHIQYLDSWVRKSM